MKYVWLWIAVCVLFIQAQNMEQANSQGYDLLEWIFEPELDGSVHVEVMVTTSRSSPNYYFRFSKDQPVANMTAQEVETGNPIEINEIDEGDNIRYSFNFGSDKDKGFEFLIKFDRLNEVVKTGDNIYYFDWEWEGTNEHVVTVILPRNCLVDTTDSEYPVNTSSYMGRVSITIKSPSLSSIFSFGVKFRSLSDEDDDGVVDDEDDCHNPGCSLVDAQGCPKDSDGDGVTDCDDGCPYSKGSSADKGCPVSPSDNDSDNDGVTDDQDSCDNPGCTVVDSQGCPKDTDSDGVADCDDDCPIEAGPSDNGCPDKDNDGVPDNEDMCDNPGCTQVDLQGCPLDTDSDGVTDCDDNCLYEAGPQKNNGCPSTLSSTVLVVITLTVISVPAAVFLFMHTKRQKTKPMRGDDTIMYDDDTTVYDDHTRIY